MTTPMVENNIGKPPLTPSTLKRKQSIKKEFISPTKQNLLYNNKTSLLNNTVQYTNTPYERYVSSDVSQHKPSLTDLFRPHVESFNYAVTDGLDSIVQDIQPVSIDLPNKQIFRYWIDNIQIGTPQKINDDSLDTRLYPNEVCNNVDNYILSINYVV